MCVVALKRGMNTIATVMAMKVSTAGFFHHGDERGGVLNPSTA